MPRARCALDHAQRATTCLAIAAIEALPVKSCVVDGEAIVCDDDGLAVFGLLRIHDRNGRPSSARKLSAE